MQSILKGVAALLVVGLLVLAALVIALPGMADRLQAMLPFGTDEVDRTGPAVLERIQDVSRLEAAVGTFQVVVDTEQDVRFLPSFIAGERSLFVARGSVDAYVDLSGLTEDDVVVSEDGTSVEVRLPPAVLDRPSLDPEDTRLFSQDRGLINMGQDFFSPQDQSELYQEAEERLATAAAESDLASQAEANAEEFLDGLFEELGMDASFVETERVE